MNFPSIPGIVDLVQLQNAVALLLLSDDRLASVPILTELKLHMDNEIAVDALWTLPRAAIQVKPGTIDLFAAVVDTDPGNSPSAPPGGPTGIGVLVEMPMASVESPNVSGPPLTWDIPIVAIEERNTNLTAGIGQFIMAEQMAQIVADILHHQDIFEFGTLRASLIARAEDRENFHPGTNCWRVTLRSVRGRIQTQRSQIVSYAFAGGMCSLACADPVANILYTFDGTAPVKANPQALNYAQTGPFPVQSGMVVRAATWQAGKLTSSINGAIAP